MAEIEVIIHFVMRPKEIAIMGNQAKASAANGFDLATASNIVNVSAGKKATTRIDKVAKDVLKVLRLYRKAVFAKVAEGTRRAIGILTLKPCAKEDEDKITSVNYAIITTITGAAAAISHI